MGVASGLRFNISSRKTVWFHCMRRGLTMRKILLAVLCSVCLLAAANATAAQQNQTPENKDKNTAEKAADKVKEAGQQTGEKVGDVKDKTVKGAKKTGAKTKEVAG